MIVNNSRAVHSFGSHYSLDSCTPLSHRSLRTLYLYPRGAFPGMKQARIEIKFEFESFQLPSITLLPGQ